MSVKFNFNKIILISYIIFLVVSCNAFEDPDYNAGIYQLRERGNWQSAVQYLQRSVERHPNRWKGHLALIEALSQGDSREALEAQLKATLSRFPDSAKSVTLQQTTSTLLSEIEFEKIAYSYKQKSLGDKLAKKGDKPALLAQGIEVACRAKDTIAAIDYTTRYLRATKSATLPDTLRQDLSLFLGAVSVEWAILKILAEQNPNDVEVSKKMVEVGVKAGFYKESGRILNELIGRKPDILNDIKWVGRFGWLLGVKTYSERELVVGWDGCYTPDGNTLIYVKDLGKPDDPDLYFYRKSLDGIISDGTPLMKAAQQNLRAIAWPRISPDGNWLYFFGSTTKDWEPGKVGMYYLYRVRAVWGAEAQRLTDADLLLVAPYIEKDGNLLIVKRDIGSVRASVEVMRLNPNTKRQTPVVRIGEPVNAAVFSPDGDTLIFVTERGLMRRALSGGSIVVDYQLPGLSWMFTSKDGNWLAINTKMQTLVLINRTNGELTYLGEVATSFIDFRKSNLLLTRRIDNRRFVCEVGFENPVDIKKRLR